MAIKKAKTVFQVLNWCNPNTPMDAASMRYFYVNREDFSPLKEMKNHLLNELDYPKLLFTGPRGCGKETELIKLGSDRNIKRHFHVKLISDSSDDPIKLIISIIKKIVEIAKKEKVDDSGFTSEIEKFLNDSFGWEIDTETIDTFKTEIPEGISTNESKPDERAHKIIRKKPGGPPPTEIVKYIDKLTEKIYWKRFFRKKEVLILVANLDKISLEKALTLFFEKALLLTSMNCCIIYTLPLELYYHKSFNQIRRNFSDIYFISNLGTINSDESINSWNYLKLREILTKRIATTVFDPPEVINDLISYSGGVPYNLLNLVRHCALIASRAKAPWWWFFFPYKRKITQDILNNIVNRRKGLYRNTLSPDLITILKQVARDNDYPKKNNSDFLSLINQDLIVQYGAENNIKYDVDPIVKQFLAELPEPKPENEEG